ncbi:MAG: hypothetical protein JWL75_213 [Parcubacteria group bacterium]|nr:hypothetical protein [Parcubacteria group bacterium]
MVSCGAGTTYLVYERSTGEKVVGRLLGLDPDTGALQVAWSYHDDGTLESEEFYPGSSKVLPGRIAEIATVKNPDEWARLDKLFAVQAHTSMQA